MYSIMSDRMDTKDIAVTVRKIHREFNIYIMAIVY